MNKRLAKQILKIAKAEQARSQISKNRTDEDIKFFPMFNIPLAHYVKMYAESRGYSIPTQMLFERDGFLPQYIPDIENDEAVLLQLLLQSKPL